MSYQVSRDANGRPRITLSGEPSYCHELDRTAMEDLDDGVWLVLDFAVWSGPDVEAVRTALDTARHFGGSLKLGLIPYYDPEDLKAWPWFEDLDNPSPHWVLLRDGAVTWRHYGPVALDDLINMLSVR